MKKKLRKRRPILTECTNPIVRNGDQQTGPAVDEKYITFQTTPVIFKSRALFFYFKVLSKDVGRFKNVMYLKCINKNSLKQVPTDFLYWRFRYLLITQKNRIYHTLKKTIEAILV